MINEFCFNIIEVVRPHIFEMPPTQGEKLWKNPHTILKQH